MVKPYAGHFPVTAPAQTPPPAGAFDWRIAVWHLRRPGVRVVGIAVDRADAVRPFAEELGIGYPILLDDLQGSTMRRYGNRFGALPFTVITGRDGVVAYVRLGELEAGELDRVTETLLSSGSVN